MSSAARRRLLVEFTHFQKDQTLGVSGAPSEDDLMLWNAAILGPSDTPFEKGTFELTLKFSERYPYEPPKINFVSPIFHPNINFVTGQMNLGILMGTWNPAYNVCAILLSIQCILNDPIIDTPANILNSMAAQLFQENRQEYNRRVMEVLNSNESVRS